jgi:sirohydrochlorin cobaltochelatase
MKRLALALTLSLASLALFAQSREVEQDMFEAMRPTDKAAVVAVHYGSDADSPCIRLFNQKLQEAFPQCALREAWTSLRAIAEMNSRGQVRQTLTHTLEDLYKQGFTHVLIQSANMSDGVEMAYIRHEAESLSRHFRVVRIGSALLDEPADCAEVLRSLKAEYGQKKTANVLVVGCEGSDAPAHSALLDYMLREQGYADWFVVAVEGFPTLDHLQRQLKQRKLKKVNLIPFSFEPTDAALLDGLRQTLQKAGLKVTESTLPLGMLDGVAQHFVNLARHAALYRSYSPLELKMQESLGF